MDKLRRTMMFVPGANPGMLRDAPIYGADAIMFDLEDAVSLKEKRHGANAGLFSPEDL